MQKYTNHAYFCAFNLVGCSSSWPDDLKGTSFEPVNKTMQPQRRT